MVIFTASMRSYADQVIDQLDCMGVVSRRFYRDSCKRLITINRKNNSNSNSSSSSSSSSSFPRSSLSEEVHYVKDLSIVRPDRKLDKVVIIDNSPKCYAQNPDNAIPIKSWWGTDRDDKCLRNLLPLLEVLHNVKDVRGSRCRVVQT